MTPFGSLITLYRCPEHPNSCQDHPLNLAHPNPNPALKKGDNPVLWLDIVERPEHMGAEPQNSFKGGSQTCI